MSGDGGRQAPSLDMRQYHKGSRVQEENKRVATTGSERTKGSSREHSNELYKVENEESQKKVTDHYEISFLQTSG